jgi:hypothetical protein
MPELEQPLLFANWNLIVRRWPLFPRPSYDADVFRIAGLTAARSRNPLPNADVKILPGDMRYVARARSAVPPFLPDVLDRLLDHRVNFFFGDAAGILGGLGRDLHEMVPRRLPGGFVGHRVRRENADEPR